MRLTTDPADDLSPAFSPDGRSIGFIRRSKEHATFIVIPAIGGPERILFASDWPHHDFDHPSKVHQIPFTNEVRRKVFGENECRLFNIDAGGNRPRLR